MWHWYMRWMGEPTYSKRQTCRPIHLAVRERVYGEKRKMRKRSVLVWHNIIIVLGESMSRRGEMVFLRTNLITFSSVTVCLHARSSLDKVTRL